MNNLNRNGNDSGVAGRALLISLTAIAVVVYDVLTPFAAVIAAPVAERSESKLSVDLPSCKKDVEAWNRFSPYDEWLDRRRRGWQRDQHTTDGSEKERTTFNEHWKRRDVVDITWLDIDGNGWCDVITSGDVEPFNSAKSKPMLLLSPRGIYMRRANGFKPFKPGMIGGEYEGTSFTAYWDTESKSTLLVQHVYQGNLVSAGEIGDNEFHFRHMLRAAFEALAAERRSDYWYYYEEVRAYFYNRIIPEEAVWKIWEEEAQRAGVRDKLERY